MAKDRRRGRPGDEIIGKQVRVKRCVNEEHGTHVRDCVCNLIGTVVRIHCRYLKDGLSAELPSYEIVDSDKRVIRSEVTLIKGKRPRRKKSLSEQSSGHVLGTWQVRGFPRGE